MKDAIFVITALWNPSKISLIFCQAIVITHLLQELTSTAWISSYQPDFCVDGKHRPDGMIDP